MELNTDFIRRASFIELDEVRRYLEENSFFFGMYADEKGVYYTATRNRDVVYADVREAYSMHTLREMYIECLKHTVEE